MRKVIWIVLLTILILPACSSKQDMQKDTERIVSSSSWFVDKLIIVNNKVYVGTEEVADNIGEKITSIETFSSKEEEVNYHNFSNYYPAGTGQLDFCQSWEMGGSSLLV